MNKLQHYFLISFGLHIFLLFILLLASSSEVIHQNFIVFGVYSQKKLLTTYKQLKPVPFVGNRQPQSTATPKKPARKKIAKPARKKVKDKTPPKGTAIEKDNVIPKPKIKKEKKTEEAPKPAPEPEPLIEEIKKESYSAKASKDTPELEMLPEKVAEHDNNTIDFHIGHATEADSVLRKYQALIQQEISRQWLPPVGVPKGTECTVRFVISKHGHVKHFEILEKSNMLIYDLSITLVAKKFNFDESLWGKTFTIDFRQ